MTQRTHQPLMGRLILFTALLLAAATGCTTSDATSSPTPSSTSTTPPPTSASAEPSPTQATTPDPAPTPSLSEEDAIAAEAIAALKEYVALANKVENNGGEGWEELRPWWGNPEVAAAGQSFYEGIASRGEHSEGEVIVLNPVASEIQTGEQEGSNVRVVVLACFDSSSLTVVNDVGDEVDAPEPSRTLISTRLQFTAATSQWNVIGQEGGSEAC